MDMIRGDMIRGLVGQENCPSIGHDSWLGDKAQGVIVTVVEQAGHLKKWERFTKGSDPSAPPDHSHLRVVALSLRSWVT